MPRKAKPIEVPKRPPRSPEEAEDRLISLATTRAEMMLAEGTAPPSVVIHYLKLGTSREKLEQERLRAENKMLKAKAEALESAARGEEAYAEVLRAFRAYSGGGVGEDVL